MNCNINQATKKADDESTKDRRLLIASHFMNQLRVDFRAFF